MMSHFFQINDYMPHGMCLLWRPSILWPMVLGNAMIALSYFVIPIALIYLILKRRDIGFKWIFILFGAFILFCGFTHIIGIVTLWVPIYGLEAVVLAITGVISLLTAIFIWPLLPVLFKLPSPWLLGKMNNELKKSNQELDAFTYSIAHDLKSPLRAIDGFSKILLDDYSKKIDDEGRRILEIICSNTKKMTQLIEDLLVFSHMGRQDIKKEKLNMQQMVNEIYSELMVATPHRKIVFDVKALPGIKADQALIRQVWVNLISNAIKFTHTKQEAHIEVGSVVDELDTVTYYISDNGLGFDMKYVDKLFGIFQRLHGQDVEGTGIGLAIVKRIITRHGGIVGGEGKLGSGAKFYFTVPKE